jgi:serine beta-lactamase-like protein LACTB, mitochondrial
VLPALSLDELNMKVCSETRNDVKVCQMSVIHRAVFGRLATHASSSLLCLAAICILANDIGAQEAGHASLPDAIDALVQQQIKSYSVPGLSIAVTRQGQIVFSRSYGWADIENQVRVTGETLFRIGSITKSVTAAAALMLAQRHELDLDAPVQRYCASFPEKPWPVTTRELLAHIGGVRGFRTAPGVSPELLGDTHYEHLADSIALFANDPLVAKPGTRYEYSNYGYDLIGCVLEGASGKRFDDLLHTLIFSPAGMTTTTLDDSLRIVPKRSRNYTHAKDGSLRNAKCLDTSNRIPAAGLLSTADDLVHFVLALESGKLLAAAQVRQMWTEQTTDEGKRNGYALGWMIHDHNSATAVAHTGEQPGSSTILYVMPDKRSSLAILANTDAAGLWKLADQLADLLDQSDSVK